MMAVEDEPEKPQNSGNPVPRRKRILLQAFIGLGVLALFLAVGWYLTSPAFSALVRNRVIAELERITGGQVELAAFHWNLSELAFEAHGLTIHGLESPADVPYVHADRVLVRAKIVS